jgi:hypothetical protein
MGQDSSMNKPQKAANKKTSEQQQTVFEAECLSGSAWQRAQALASEKQQFLGCFCMQLPEDT